MGERLFNKQLNWQCLKLYTENEYVVAMQSTRVANGSLRK